jgi:hypothetical protein
VRVELSLINHLLYMLLDCPGQDIPASVSLTVLYTLVSASVIYRPLIWIRTVVTATPH